MAAAGFDIDSSSTCRKAEAQIVQMVLTKLAFLILLLATGANTQSNLGGLINNAIADKEVEISCVVSFNSDVFHPAHKLLV